MADRDLYLYEVVDIVGQGQYEYMEHLWKDRAADAGDEQPPGFLLHLRPRRGRWPQVINIWDIGTKAGRAGPATSTG